MKTFARLDALHHDPPLKLTIDSPCVFGSDDHRGDGGPADDNWPNKEKCEQVKAYYLSRGYTYFSLGDHEDLWQFDQDEIEMIYGKPDPKLIYLGGNHDAERGWPEACLLTHQGREYFLCHGHPGDL